MQNGKVPTSGILASLGFFLILGVVIATFARPIENMLRDVMATTISPFKSLPDDIVVVAITEQTLEKFPYRSPVDRGFLSDLVQHIDKAHPRAIGIDLLFDQPTEADKDLRLATVIDTAESPIVIASGSRDDGLTDKQLSFLDRFAPHAMRGLAALSQDKVDGIVRKAFAGREVNGKWVPSFSSALAHAAA